MKASAAKLEDIDNREHSDSQANTSKRLVASVKSQADKAMLAKMDEWSERMNRKTRLGAMDVLSKLENAIHFVKKGALKGNTQAKQGLDKVLAKMGAMSGAHSASGGN